MADRHTTLFGDQIDVTALGAGLKKDINDNLEIEVDDSSIEINVNALRVKALGITNAMLAGSIDFSKLSALTADRALVSDGSGQVSVSPVTSTEIGYLDGVTSGIQAQLNAITSGYNRREKVINIVDNTQAPPTEVSGDRYVLDETAGGVHADWDGASPNDIVEFNGTIWVATTPSEGWVVYVDSQNVDAVFVDDGTPAWETREVLSQALSDGKIFIGNVSGVATEQDVTGDITITNAGITAIGADKVTKEMINPDVAGNGVGQNVDGSLEINVDDTTVEIVTDTVQVKDSGITNIKVADDTLREVKLDASNTPTVSYQFLAYDPSTGGFTWRTRVVGEIPAGTINGVNTVFTLVGTPLGEVHTDLNGQRLAQGAGLDYTISGNTITFSKAPRTNSDLYADYVY